MKQLIFGLDKEQTRPIVNIYGFDALVDTGADIPLCNDANILTSKFNAKKVITISKDDKAYGPKGVAEKLTGDIYDIPVFELGELIYPHLRIMVPDKALFKTHFILSMSMFYNLILTIDSVDSVMTVTVPDGQQLIRNTRFVKDGKHYVFTSQFT